MEKSRERKCLEKHMEMMYDDKTVTIAPDFGTPYTLIIVDGDGNGGHTHSSFYPDSERARDENIKGCTDSFINHILPQIKGYKKCLQEKYIETY